MGQGKINRTEVENKIRFLEMLNDLPVKYGPGSTIVIQPRDHSNPLVFDVIWFDKVGGSFPLKNISYEIPENWIGMDYDKAVKLSSRFQSVLKLPYLSDEEIEVDNEGYEEDEDLPQVHWVHTNW